MTRAKHDADAVDCDIISAMPLRGEVKIFAASVDRYTSRVSPPTARGFDDRRYHGRHRARAASVAAASAPQHVPAAFMVRPAVDRGTAGQASLAERGASSRRRRRAHPAVGARGRVSGNEASQDELGAERPAAQRVGTLSSRVAG